MIQRGILDRVTSTPLGTKLDADAPATSTTLVVDWTVEFSETGGLLSLNGVVLAYVSRDEDASTITLAEPLAVAAVADDQVLSLSDAGEPRSKLEAFVAIDAGVQSVPHAIGSSLDARLTESTPPGTPVLVDTATRTIVGLDSIPVGMDGAAVWNPHLSRRATTRSVPSSTSAYTVVTGWTDEVSQGLTVEADGSVTIDHPGFYAIDIVPRFDFNGSGGRSARLSVNGAVFLVARVIAATVGETDVALRPRRLFEAGDNIVLEVQQTSGAALDLQGFPNTSPFSIYRVSV